MNVDVGLVVQVVSLLGSAAVVSWRFSAVATQLQALATKVGELAVAHEKDREKGEASRERLAGLEVEVAEVKGRLGAVEEKLK